MTAVSPVVAGFEEAEVVLARNQPEYLPLPALPIVEPGEDADSKGIILTRWEPTKEDKERIMSGGSIYLWVYTFGRKMLPVKITTDEPELQALIPDSVVPSP